MPYDPNSKLFRPDFGTPQISLPEWAPMGDDSSGVQMSPLIDKLKGRMNPTTPLGTKADTIDMGNMAQGKSSGGKMSL